MTAGFDTPTGTLSLGASIVLFRSHVRDIAPLIQQLQTQGARLIYLIDNSPPPFDAFSGWTPPSGIVTISTRKNLGYGRAHNLAIRDSVRRHQYHLVCNPDITMGDDTLRVLAQALDERPDIGLCAPRVHGTDGQLHYLCKRPPSPADFVLRRFAPDSWFQRRRDYYEMRDHSYSEEMEPTFMSGCFMFFRSEVLRVLDGFDERFFLYMEDVDLSRRAKQVARNLYYPRTTIVHGHERGAYKSLRLFSYFATSIVRYFNKWGWFERSWLRANPTKHS
jgi:GT2 family glycosyltransferase